MAAAVVVSLQSAFAEEVWQCSQIGGRSLITTAPARSIASECRRQKLSGASFSRIPYAGKSLKPQALSDHRPSSVPTGDRGAGQLADVSAEAKPYISWKASEKVSPAGEKVACTLSGEAACATGGSGTLIIYRGGAQIDRFPLLLKGRMAKSRWEVELAGDCRNAQVTLKPP